jgi:hypothetical protein
MHRTAATAASKPNGGQAHSIMASAVSATDRALVEQLRARLARRTESLVLLRRRIEAARSGVSTDRPLSSVNDISRRFMNAAAESEARGHTTRPVVTGGAGVGSLLSKWNEGFAMKEAERERVHVRGDVRGATDKFSKADSSLAADVMAAKRSAAGRVAGGGRDVIAVEDDDVPSWAINQTRRVIHKENAKAKTGNVNIDVAKGSISSRGSAEVDTSGVREEVRAGNVGGVIAMWGQKAEDHQAKEREEQMRVATMKSLRSDFEKRTSREEPAPEPVEEIVEEPVAAEELIYMDSDDDEEEPTDIRELVEYLERKCERVQKKINFAEHEVEKIDRLSQ